MNRRILVGVVAAGLAAGLAAPLSAQEFVRIGSGLAGTYPIFGAKLAEIINQNIEGVQASTLPGGTEGNLIKLQKGEVEMSIAYTFIAKMVFDGEGALGFAVPDMRHVMTTYGSILQPVATKKSGVTSLDQADDGAHRVWGSTKASVFYPLVMKSLEANDVTPESVKAAGGVMESVGYRDTVQAMQDGRLDVSFFAGPVPYSLTMQASQSPGITVLGFSEEAAKKFPDLLPGTSMATIPGGTYEGNPDDAVLPYMVNQVVASAAMSDDLVYQITKAMNEHYMEFHGLFAWSDQIDPKKALEGNQLPIHPGAERYYREVGLLK